MKGITDVKKWECKTCGRVVLAFGDDVEKMNHKTFEELEPPKLSSHPVQGCEFQPISSYNQSTIHGEAGFMTEGTMFDSTSTIHDQESRNLIQAEDDRELFHYVDAIKNM